MKPSLLSLALALPLAAGAPVGPSAQVKRGAYLTTIMGCADCHTPMKLGPHGPEPDMSLAFSGHPAAMKLPPAPAGLGHGPWMWAGAATNTAFAGPWGVSFAANLTPDKSGLGEWTPEMFVKAIKSGKHLGKGRPILPPMPQPAFSHATDEDLLAIFAYLRTITPIENKVPDPIDPMPAPAPAPAPAAGTL